jgi:adenine-specific DNA-methyltransferase
MSRKQKLELTWVGKEQRQHLEPRILIEDPELTYHAATRNADDTFDNLLIQGDNLLALKALEQDFAGKVKCVFIDPPYNTGSAFTHYEDGLEHSAWLSLIRDRLEIIRRLLTEDGSLWITIDDNEAHYLKVLCDETFGRANFVANVVWQKAYTANQTALHISNVHDHILVVAKDASNFRVGKIPRTDEQRASFKNPDNDHRGPWKAENLSAGKFYSAGQFEIAGPSGQKFLPPRGRYWRCNEEQYRRWLDDNRITFGLSKTGRPMLKKFLSEMEDGLTATTWWPHEEVGSNKQASIELKEMLPDVPVFQNPKPEQLIRRILDLSTNNGDIVLDSFAGSGTTGAVAHKMGRKWVLVELGDHAVTHCAPRLRKVIDGSDSGGVTEAVGWQGGGGFRFCRLATSLLARDRFGNWVVAREYNPAMLAEAMCKLMGFRYAPSQEPEAYWQHGYSSESDFIYVTTQSLTHDALRKLSEEVGPKRTLLICCKAFSGRAAAFENLTIKKIPQAVLTKCEWARDDYSLRVASLPLVDEVSADLEPNAGGEPEAVEPKRRGRSRKVTAEAGPLFAEVDTDGDGQ